MLRSLSFSCALALAMTSVGAGAADMTGEELFTLCQASPDDCAAQINRALQPYIAPEDGSPPKICPPDSMTDEDKVAGLMRYMDAKHKRNGSWLGRQNADRMVAVYFVVELGCQ